MFTELSKLFSVALQEEERIVSLHLLKVLLEDNSPVFIRYHFPSYFTHVFLIYCFQISILIVVKQLFEAILLFVTAVEV